MTNDPQPSPGILEFRRREAAEAEQLRRIYADAVRRSEHAQVDASEGGAVRILPDGSKCIGRRGGWEQMVASSYDAVVGRAAVDEQLYYDARWDPDSLQEENRTLSTPDARVVARADHLTVGGAGRAHI